MRWEIIRQADAVAALKPAWTALWQANEKRPVTLHPAWVDAWWRSFGGAPGGGGELLTVAVYEGGDLVGVAPFYLQAPRGGALWARELRLAGDGLVGVGQTTLAARGFAAKVADAVAEALAAEPGWDLLDLTLSDGGDAESLARRFGELGRDVARDEARGRPVVDLVAPWERFVESVRASGTPAALEAAASLPAGVTVSECAARQLPEGLEVLETLLRRHRVEGAPAHAGLVGFLAQALPALVDAGVATLRLLEAPGRGPVAGGVVLFEDARHVELLRAGEPNAALAERLTLEALHRAVDAGARRFEFAEGSALAVGRAMGQRVRVFRRSAAGVISRSYASLLRHANTLSDDAMDRIDRFRDVARDVAPEAVTRVVARVATFSRMHLYRGELYVRPERRVPDVELRLFSLADFLALDPAARARLCDRLDLVEERCRQQWERGDLVVLAELAGQPVGILWCARDRVHVPDIGREVRLPWGEGYIHDVYVAPEARGRAVAPAMLDFAARELRGRDVYRAWALIDRSNTPSTRAFEKAGWVSVADVIYARMGGASKLLVRPPDPDARAFLGLAKR